MLEVKVSPEGEVIGYASLWGGPADAVNDIVQPGAYRNSLSTGLPLMLREHKGAPIGQWTDATEDDIGLKVRGIVTDAATLADLRTGRLDGLSIGFIATKAHRDTAGRRVLDEMDLREISIVKRPASSRARVLSVKSFPPAAGAAPNSESMTMEDQTTAAPDTGTTETTETKGVDITAAVTAALAPVTTRLETVERMLRRPGGGTTAETKSGPAPEVKAFSEYLRYGTAGLDAVEVKALRLSDDESGGYLAPPEFVAEIDKNLVQFSPIRGIATVRNTARSEAQVPRRTGAPTAHWVEEDDDRPETETKYGLGRYPVKEIACYIDVPLALLEDAGVDVSAELAMDLAEEFGRAEGEAFVTGSGVGRPFGFMNDADIGFVKSGHASQVTADGLIDLFHAVPTFYRTNGVWVLNSATLGVVRKLKDGTTGQYLLMTQGIGNAPVTTLLGRPVIEAPDMPDVAGNAFPIVFGDFGQGYRVFDRIGTSILRDDLTQRTKGKVRFHARKRVAGGVRKAEALKKLKIAA
ncbi:phage major capsid protein [Roseomonas genomospecies 6]|uniref:Phage major capsid protein n=1 Tax=Roseomonas genomospecies 6 TaxID=214106 RepID=A0A9W7NJ68_9PROT|nr:phage major capsid protein [Roseomonas genomospecies 6]KAA0680289.1 phage major capsid protein [Roseomonas genomospecies 6]